MTLPERLEGADGLLLRRWTVGDAASLGRAIGESADHLRPWMPWVVEEPLTLERRRAMINDWERAWRGGGDVLMGIFVAGQIVGGCGLHRRIGPEGLEIGYWTHRAFLRQGVATGAARLLSNAALALPGITHVEIHHDKANQASGGVPRRLGYRWLADVPDVALAPGEVGISCRWRLTGSELG